MKISNQSNVTYNAVEPDKPGVPGRLASNTVNTEVLSDAITKVMSTDKTFAKEGDTVHETITVTNNSSTVLAPVYIMNPKPPQGASYVAGSVKVNGVALPNANPVTGFSLPNLNPGETVTVEYDMQITAPSTVTAVTDSAEFLYTVKDPERGNVTFTDPIDAVTVNIAKAKLSVVKTVDKTFALKGETLTYTITFTNEGNIDINDIYFTDNIPQGTTFVEQSVWINEQNFPAYRPDVGYSVANLIPNASATTRFQVTID